jgi:hypothetical protein
MVDATPVLNRRAPQTTAEELELLRKLEEQREEAAILYYKKRHSLEEYRKNPKPYDKAMKDIAEEYAKREEEKRA